MFHEKAELSNADCFKRTGIIALGAAFAELRRTRHGKFEWCLLLEHFLRTYHGGSAGADGTAFIRLTFLKVDYCSRIWHGSTITLIPFYTCSVSIEKQHFD
jgi:hypothetical protein